MPNRPAKEFGKRRPSTIAPTGAHPVKRSRHVALLLMGSLALGGGAFAMMAKQDCEPSGGGMAGPSLPQSGSDCGPRGSSSSGGRGGSGGSSSRSSFFGGDASSNRASSGASSESGSGQTTRGGFGSFARAIGFHFSGS